MASFEPMRDFYQRRQIVCLDALANDVRLLNVRSESPGAVSCFPVPTTWTTSRSVATRLATSITASVRWAIACTSTCSKSNGRSGGRASAWPCCGSCGARTKCRLCRWINAPHPMVSGTGLAGDSQRPAPCSVSSCAATSEKSWNSNAGSTWCRNR